jgi:hypothetical protein
MFIMLVPLVGITWPVLLPISAGDFIVSVFVTDLFYGKYQRMFGMSKSPPMTTARR